MKRSRRDDSKEVQAEVLSRLSTEGRRAVLKILSPQAFKRRSWCYIHHTECALDPRDDLGLEGCFHIDWASNTCTPWSTFGAQLGWLDITHTAVVLTWAMWCRLMSSPDLVLDECTPTFDVQWLHQNIFELRLRHWEGLEKCLGLEQVCGKDEGYMLKSMLINPTDLGIPSSRQRRMSAWFAQGDDGYSIQIGADFMKVFRAELSLTAAVFLSASQEDIDEEKLLRAMETQVHMSEGDLKSSLQTLRWSEVLHPAKRIRLQEYKRAAQEDGVWEMSPSVALMDLNQTVGHMQRRICTQAAPALLKDSDLYDLVLDRPLAWKEYLQIQGYSVKSGSNSNSSFAEQVSVVSGKQIRKMAGNGVHSNVAGAWMAFCVSCMKKKGSAA